MQIHPDPLPCIPCLCSHPQRLTVRSVCKASAPHLFLPSYKRSISRCSPAAAAGHPAPWSARSYMPHLHRKGCRWFCKFLQQLYDTGGCYIVFSPQGCERLYLSCDAADRQSLQQVGKPLFKAGKARSAYSCTGTPSCLSIYATLCYHFKICDCVVQ